MNRAICITILATACLAATSCDKKPAPPPPPTTPGQNSAPKQSWSAEDIVRDPQGYLVWSNDKVAAQTADREKRLAAVTARRADWQRRRDEFETSLSDLENIQRRLKEAYQRADDEDRWPLKFAGYSLSREKAQAALDQLQKRIADGAPDRKVYDDLLAKMDDAAGAIRKDLRQLARLKSQLEADLEKVRLTQDMAKVDELRKTENQLASMSKAAVHVTEDPSALPAPAAAQRVNLDEILK